jgi:hypothetical protein
VVGGVCEGSEEGMCIMDNGIGYFAQHQYCSNRSKTHIVIGGNPICNSKIKRKFQWCSSYKETKYLECKKCQKLSLSL